MQQPYTLTSSLEICVPHVKNGLKGYKMANKNVREIQSQNPKFTNPTRSMEHKNHGFVRQNFAHANQFGIQEYTGTTWSVVFYNEKFATQSGCKLKLYKITIHGEP